MGGFIDDTLGTNIFGENSTDKALSAQRQGTNQANNALTTAYTDQKKYLNPYYDIGTKALSQLASGNIMGNMQGDRGSVEGMDPGYSFRLAEGQKAIQQSAAAMGGLNSGAAMKALARYGQDYASNEYNNAYNRKYQTLSQLAGMGENAASNMVNATANYGNSMSNNYMGLGNAQASANIANANRSSNLLGQGATAAAMYFSDERLKDNIEPISRDEIQEFKESLRALKYAYKDKQNGEGEWIGVLAQDLEKSELGKTVVVSDEDGHKAIDLKKAVSLLFAIVAGG